MWTFKTVVSWVKSLTRFLYELEDGKNFPQTSFWLCTFQILSLSQSPHASSAKCCRISSPHGTMCGLAPSCHTGEWANTWMAEIFLEAITYIRITSDGITIHKSNYKAHRNISLNFKSAYPQPKCPLSESPKCLQPLQGHPTPGELSWRERGSRNQFRLKQLTFETFQEYTTM